MSNQPQAPPMNTLSPMIRDADINALKTDTQCHRRRRLQRELSEGENGGIWSVEGGVWKEVFGDKGGVL